MSVAMNPLPGRKPNADHRILICEDDALIAMGWAAMLADGGYTVVGPAHSAEKALKMAYQHLPSLALVDIDSRRPRPSMASRYQHPSKACSSVN